jgi:hypothetical protein
MHAQPASVYFDRPCESPDQFERIRAELEGQGFKNVGNSPTSEELYHQMIEEETRGNHDKMIAQARQQQHFRNEVEERTWKFKDRGYQVVRTQGFNVDGTPLDDLVAFFVKPPAEQ